MSAHRPFPIYDISFWWQRLFCGLLLPAALAGFGIYSLISLHSYAIPGLYRTLKLVIPVDGEQAVLMGIAYLGMALMLFANCYAQYHEKIASWYEPILSAGALATIIGIGWCSCIFIAG